MVEVEVVEAMEAMEAVEAARGAGRDGAMDTGAGIVTSPVGGKQVKTFKSYQGKQCNRDYKRLCPTTPIGKCDLAGKIDQLSPSCKAFVEAH
ncbi:hypothetical protein ACFSQQ_35035 [Mesorhizobium kowhaii]|uniref:hypothetical protein n=1 Tax=Mesorhizobium kowhaii TaxID=1300272 RepID=UPI0036393B5A